MRIGVPKEVLEGERRVAVVPRMVEQLREDSHEVHIERDAGKGSFFLNSEYEKAGALLAPHAKDLYTDVEMILKIHPPTKCEVEMMNPRSTYIGFLFAASRREIIRYMKEKSITSFAMECIPRLARTQSMDALSSMASIAGYRAVLMAANHLGKFFPLLMTAAGTIPPAKVLILGAGVAGLQAIATARRLGAHVEAFDTRPAVREQVESLGAHFVEMEPVKDAETASGYAKEMTEEFLKKEREVIGNRITLNDVVITTAQVFGGKAPILITEEMVKTMKRGSVIVDLAAEQGGNCELSEVGKTIVKYDIVICGEANLQSTLPVDASSMYSKNIVTFFRHLHPTKDSSFDFEDEITKSTCITHDGKIKNEVVEKAFEKELNAHD
ncbi:MAG: Re/Si-specific NAD(P)(+) transhydrogenase subunit alpha [Candidatus Scalindua sp. AMX11]|nr:MAG: Re/Si-specific NAD(P)(+) transhydrogenase subunit alpha [Candidatus Scalindua sp.]NOG84971.1 Re/Si-specific NAD(P)(+) transhydrogenase subunit alpha [Planctomycetota bacterium]RZV93026.1 MAG: Re/Si-specific NAD(P)(+) transhydrogenase subunit alpha [Candidatus Scalindua sp. SCAELEC01]TDE66647.1 MAG: Re/Si-specific NAD(P)(+) transhydrogenase subunit alpha [Candidatus Scalindua sp. AMX11]GJQ57953.1 MAG: NAD(P) transhydrogenase subunit alpha [Candidatus Scalindua sp.]